ncbi:23S rRNA (uracil(747)-C(5))-methyltransferase RlmC [Shewanella sp. A32]|uniref:23S rRNA (uracil(747)-C(5))-methyltransferase RlmC n=1 Tax=Shewanella sp. A32 TaxID=3031327 RepID=UPI0023B8E3CF|nr:23S rRNA (uracil(747)-C(5))-methyltransferase RlmC [Shewanella sp. A32]MDF0533935.1 23S rRNA (uracil(747)-C(5))-methyltransferase RlmC [Shewanella sp. A32]
MICHHFAAGSCQSCRHIQQPLTEQLAAKQSLLQQLLAPFAAQEWLPPVSGPQTGFRNKAKMVVLGAAHQPILGIPGPDGEPVSLCDCPLYPADMQQLLQQLQQFVQQAGIPPYRIDKARGELKFILLTRAQVSGEFMLRFVLRSSEAIPRIERQLPGLLQAFPSIKVVTVNLQPVHMARLEGEEEIWLAGEPRLREVFNEVPLYIRPKSFFQTNPVVAAQLYQSAREWLRPIAPSSVWDLFCGVGGFGLHCANGDTQLTGIEIEAEAIACARLSAQQLGLENVNFQALDSTDFAAGKNATEVPDVIIVNPPRRGIGNALCQQLSDFAPAYILYSSCNPQSLAQDLAAIDGYCLQRVQLFDMFPHTDHFEVLALLRRNA